MSQSVIVASDQKKTEIRIFAVQGAEECKVFTASVSPRGDLVVASGWKGFRVRRINGDGTPQDGPEAIVDNPHVTFHPPHYWHLTPGRRPFITEGLVWTDPVPHDVASPWLTFISPPLRDLPFRTRAPVQPRRKIRWIAPIPHRESSFGLVVDFVRRSEVLLDPHHVQSRYILSGENTFRFRPIFMNEAREATVDFTIMG